MVFLRIFFIVMLTVSTVSASYASTDCSSFFSKKGFQTLPITHTDREFAAASRVAKLYEARTSKQHLQYDSLLTNIHAQLEMNFQVKNPQTGFYDKFQSVPVNTRTAVLSEDAFSGLVSSIGPVIRVLRIVLQKVYSGANLDIESLGLQELPAKDAEFFLNVIRESIYLEPELMSPVMRNYPFIAVAGFDGAIGNPDRPEAKFFEMNLGTPSGLGNNALLRENLLKVDRSLQRLVGNSLPEDKSFENLKKVIDDNAFAWTGIKKGISVVISPGVYNGAHADVVEISRRSGMPLVRSSDLYTDRQGLVRLYMNLGEEKDPVVTGVYGRMEESFFFQNSKSGIALINPNYVEINNKLSKKLGLQLREAAIYKYIYNDKNEIVDVERDRSGQALLLDVWDTVRDNPYTGQKSLPFHKVLLDKKLYYSAIGGRVVDDKRLFQLITKYLVKESGPIAEPVSSLSHKEFYKLYQNPKAYVVKEPANSGGVGVHFLSQMSAKAREALLKKVRKDPYAYEVQEFRTPNTLVSYSNEQGQIIRDEVAIDLRIFAFMDSKGKVQSGPNAALLRTAARGSFYSNTSQGGGYGILLVLSDKMQPTQSAKRIQQPVLLSYSRVQELKLLVDQLQSLEVSTMSPQELMNLSFSIRAFLDVIPDQLRPVLTQIRDLAEGKQKNITELKALIQKLLLELKRQL